jgi:hypothetical protein
MICVAWFTTEICNEVPSWQVQLLTCAPIEACLAVLHNTLAVRRRKMCTAKLGRSHVLHCSCSMHTFVHAYRQVPIEACEEFSGWPFFLLRMHTLQPCSRLTQFLLAECYICHGWSAGHAQHMLFHIGVVLQL